VPDERPQAPGEKDRAALAARALAAAKADASARGSWPGTPAEDKFTQQNGTSPSPAASRPPRRARREDPAPLDAAISGLVADTGWELAVAAGSVFGRWAQIVGADLAAHTAPDGLADGELTVIADSTAWATQLRLLASDLVRRLNAELGDGTVRRVKVRGPAGPPRRAGQWRVRGGRGPRDTYG
jgi:predicted nucleic acid-binding Zn ribbon protein